MAAADQDLLELLPDAIADFDPERVQLLPRNAAMRALLGSATAAPLARLLDDPAQGDALLAGDAVELLRDGGCWQLRLLPAAAPRWLLARGDGERQQLHGQLQAAARARALAALANGVVHDLGNLLNSALGLVEQVPAATAAADAGFTARLVQGTRQGAELLRTLARQLQDTPRRRQVLDLDALAGRVLALCGKAAAQRGQALQWQPGSGVRGRGVAEDVEFALLQALLRALSAAPGAPIAVAVDAAAAPLCGGRERRLARIRVAAAGRWIGELAGEHAGELPRAMLLLRRQGGDLRAEPHAGGETLWLELPQAVP